MARGYTQFRKRNNQVQSDPFASAKAMSKAQRNALNNLFDSNLVAKIVKEWIKRGHVTQLKQPSAKDQLKVTEDEQKNIDPWVNKIKMVKTRKDYDNVIKAAMTANLTGKEIAFIRKAYEQHHGKPTP